MTQSPPEIDLPILHDILASAERMVAYYSKGDEKRAQNAALIAAGLPILHSELSLQWDVKQAELQRRYVGCLRAVIGYFEPTAAEPAQGEAA